MLIYNITFQVNTSQEQTWFSWIKEVQIPGILESQLLFEPQLARILGDHPDTEKSFSLQFKAESMGKLAQWHRQSGNEFSRACKVKFGDNVLFFSTVLEIIS